MGLKPSKADPQGAGSAITYGRRYAMQALCNLAAEDDDGNGASKAPRAQAAQPTAPQNRVAQNGTASSNVDALVARWTAVTGQDREALKAAVSGPVTLSSLRLTVEAAERAKASPAAQQTASTPQPARKPLAQRQREAAMAAFADLGMDDAARHAWYPRCGHYGKDGSELRSWADVVAAGKESAVLELLAIEKAHQDEMTATEALI
jgi:hypothetical protein